jgi:hypothetical protein
MKLFVKRSLCTLQPPLSSLPRQNITPLPPLSSLPRPKYHAFPLLSGCHRKRQSRCEVPQVFLSTQAPKEHIHTYIHIYANAITCTCTVGGLLSASINHTSPLLTGAAGYDLSSAKAMVVPAHGKAIAPTDLSIKVPEGWPSRASYYLISYYGVCLNNRETTI